MIISEEWNFFVVLTYTFAPEASKFLFDQFKLEFQNLYLKSGIVPGTLGRRSDRRLQRSAPTVGQFFLNKKNQVSDARINQPINQFTNE